jgi:hypothetical protein
MAQIASGLAAPPLRRVALLPGLPSWRYLLPPLALALVIALAAAFYLAHTGNLATSGYSIQRLQSERSQWRIKNEQLRVELAKIRSLGWVEHEAVSRLGMQRPVQHVYLTTAPTDTRAANTR